MGHDFSYIRYKCHALKLDIINLFIYKYLYTCFIYLDILSSIYCDYNIIVLQMSCGWQVDQSVPWVLEWKWSVRNTSICIHENFPLYWISCTLYWVRCADVSREMSSEYLRNVTSYAAKAVMCQIYILDVPGSPCGHSNSCHAWGFLCSIIRPSRSVLNSCSSWYSAIK
jgi:hypothetical protein